MAVTTRIAEPTQLCRSSHRGSDRPLRKRLMRSWRAVALIILIVGCQPTPSPSSTAGLSPESASSCGPNDVPQLEAMVREASGWRCSWSVGHMADAAALAEQLGMGALLVAELLQAAPFASVSDFAVAYAAPSDDAAPTVTAYRIVNSDGPTVLAAWLRRQPSDAVIVEERHGPLVVSRVEVPDTPPDAGTVVDYCAAAGDVFACVRDDGNLDPIDVLARLFVGR